VLVEFVKSNKIRNVLDPIDKVMKDGKPRTNGDIVSAIMDLSTHGGMSRRVVPTIMQVAMYLKNNQDKYEYEKIKEMRIWKMKI